MGNSFGLSCRAGERGQGLTEYLIIIALIAIAAIGVYSFFGERTVSKPPAGAAREPSGKAVANEAAGARPAPDKGPAKPADAKGGDAKDAGDTKSGAAGK
jgi:hypothetical protein